MVVPFVGKDFGAIAGGAAAIGRIFTLVSDGDKLALIVGEIVADSKSAPFVILDLLVGLASLGGGEATISKVEELRRHQAPVA